MVFIKKIDYFLPIGFGSTGFSGCSGPSGVGSIATGKDFRLLEQKQFYFPHL
ncbi:hypothetical protein ACPCXA_01990 [Lysinibacillus agricola]